MRIQLSTTHNVVSLLVDELAYRAVRFINDRALRRQTGNGPLCASISDPICHRLVATGTFERTQAEGVDALLSAESPIDLGRPLAGIFIDVGANIGFYTTRYAARFKKTLAIEANPITFDVLQGNIRLSKIDNATALCVGASNRTGELPLHIPNAGILGWASFRTPDIENLTHPITVPLQTIDRLVEQHAPGERVSMMKIDVEGHEQEVLQGAIVTLKADRPIVLYEQLSGRAGAECGELLRDAGYNRFFVFKRTFGAAAVMAKSSVYAEQVDPERVEYAAMICAL